MRKADNLPPSCAVVTKSGNLSFLELSGPFQACNGTVLPCLYVDMVCYIPGCICCGYESFGLGSLHDEYVGLAGATPRFSEWRNNRILVGSPSFH